MLTVLLNQECLRWRVWMILYWLIRSSFSISIQRSWLQYQMDRQSDIGEWGLTIVFEIDIPSLTRKGIQMRKNSFSNVKELTSSSMIDELIMIEMLILWIDLFDRRANIYRVYSILTNGVNILMNCVLFKWIRFISSYHSWIMNDSCYFIHCT